MVTSTPTFRYPSFSNIQWLGDIMKYTDVTQLKARLSCLIVTLALSYGGAAFAQPVRIAASAATFTALPTWGGHDGVYFAREGVPAELIYIRGGPQTMSALVSGEVPFAQIYGGALLSAGAAGGRE